MGAVTIIGCIVGIISCIIGISSFLSAQITKAKQDGVLIEKIDQCCKGIDEIKKDMKETTKELNDIVDAHSKDIIEIKTRLVNVEHEVFK